MLLNSVIIILREVLEAALLFSVLLALSKQSAIKSQWVFWSVIMGISGAAVFGLNMAVVSEWFDYVGQEVTNAIIQLMIYFLLLIFISMQFKLYLLLKDEALYMNVQRYNKTQIIQRLRSMLTFFMVVITTLAITREGAEMMLYFFSVTRNESHYSSTLIGMIIGFSIGVSVGFLFYYLLLSLHQKWSMIIALSLLILVSSGMISQATQLLIQADWIEAQLPLWDSTHLLSEQSVPGQLLYALIGYESTPSAIQVILYVSSMLLPVFIILYFWKSHSTARLQEL